MVFYLFDRWDGQIGTILGVLSAKRACEVNGEHTLTIETLSHLEKGQRIVYCDDCGKFREFIVQEVIEDHEDGAIITTATCEDSLAELNGDYLVEKEPTGTASAALSVALGTSRWQVGRVDVGGSKHFSFYHCSAREAVNEIAEAFDGEVSATVEVSGGYITARKVNVTKRVGADNGKRFAYRKDLSGITRTVEIDDVVTALYGYGKGLEQVDEDGEATGGFDRKLTFGDVNGGLDYVYDAAALERWGRPDGKGGKAHVYGRVEFSDCEDKHELLTLTRNRFNVLSEPRVSYSASVINMRAAGFLAEGVSEGDTVQIVDEAFDPPLRLSGRVLKIVEDLLAPEETVITLGNIQENIAGTILEMGQSVQGIKNHASSWDGAASISSAFIDAVLKRLNEEFDAGGSYKYESFEVGTIYSSVPLDDNFKPKQTPATAFQLTGMGFRIASDVKSNGDFDWRTIGTGEGFTADCLTAGEIRGGANRWNLETGDLEFKQGGIRDSKGRNSWNLDTGEFSLSASATIGGKTAAVIAKDAVDAQTQTTIFNKLTGGGQTQGIYLSGGKVYINATYLKTGIISDQYGRNTWNLLTGALSTRYMTANDATVSGTMTTGYDTSYQAKMTGGYVRFFFNKAETIELVSIPSYTSGAKGGYLQCCNGATYLGLRAPKLYTAVNTSEAGTTGYTGTIRQKVSSGGHIGTFTLTVINGLVVSSGNWDYE